MHLIFLLLFRADVIETQWSRFFPTSDHAKAALGRHATYAHVSCASDLLTVLLPTHTHTPNPNPNPNPTQGMLDMVREQHRHRRAILADVFPRGEPLVLRPHDAPGDAAAEVARMQRIMDNLRKARDQQLSPGAAAKVGEGLEEAGLGGQVRELRARLLSSGG